VLTGGGPAGATKTIVYYIYNNAFQWFKMGYAAALSVFLFFVMMIFTIIQWKMGQESTTSSW
jgi:multiple sugar transport system permease protein